ncbi:MAG TPA: response regulator [Bryobacteraceae bacterium]|nr:response regulator [Bryobacteraceae bacterium]
MATSLTTKGTLTVLLIEDSPDYAALVQNWLSSRTEISFVLNWTDSLQAGLSRLDRGGVDVVLLDLGLPDSNGPDTYNRIKLKAQGLPVLLLSGDDGEKQALQMVHDGAQDYIVKSACNASVLVKAIQYAVMRTSARGERTSAQPSAEATLIGVMGVKGGVGASTIACNLAVELRRQTTKNTLLVDLDLVGGMIGFLMAAESQYSILDAVANIHRFDQSFCESMVAHSADVQILCPPGVPSAAEPNADDLKHVLGVIRKLYGLVVVDMGRPATFSLSLLDQVSELLLVTTTSLPALYQTKLAIHSLREAGLEKDRLKIIVNQVSIGQEFSTNELDSLFGMPVYVRFPPSNQELHDACVKKEVAARNGQFGAHTRVLAQKLAGVQPAKPKGRVSRLFSFAEKPYPMESTSGGNRESLTGSL